MSASPLTVIAVTRAKPGHADALRAAQEQLVADTLREDGCLRYELHQSLEDPHLLIFVESWQSEEKLQAHLTGAAIARFDASGARAHLADLVIHRMEKIAG